MEYRAALRTPAPSPGLPVHCSSAVIGRIITLYNSAFHSVQSTLRAAFLLLLCALLLCGCGGGGGDTAPVTYQSDGTSGLRGTAYVQNADGTITPYANSNVAATKVFCAGITGGCGARNVVTAATDAQGRFTLPVIAGTYGFAFVRPPNAPGYIYSQSVQFTVVSQQITSATPVGLVNKTF